MTISERERQFKVIHEIYELKKLVSDNPRDDLTLEQFSDDLHALALRYLRGNVCGNPKCKAYAKLPEIASEVFCSQRCQGAVQARAIEEEQRVSAAMEQYGGVDA